MDSELPMEGAVGIPSAEQWSCGISIWEKNLGKKFLAGRIPKEFPVAVHGFPGIGTESPENSLWLPLDSLECLRSEQPGLVGWDWMGFKVLSHPNSWNSMKTLK